MGLFGKLFEKKVCAICNNEIGLFGNRKLEDGNMCKNCASLLSPFFSERRSSTVVEIKEQLAYRQANKEEVAKFHPTLTLGDHTKIIFDESARQFIVTNSSRWQKENPDIIKYDQVTGCDFEIKEDVTEAKRENSEGEEVSYIPARYYYEYDFYITIHINHPYFNEIEFKLNASSVDITDGNAVIAMKKPNLSNHYEYQRYVNMGNEIKEQLLEVREQIKQATTEKAAVVCPYCGASTFPDEYGRCEYCKGSVKV